MLLADLEAHRAVLEHHMLLRARGLIIDNHNNFGNFAQALLTLKHHLFSSYKSNSRWLSDLPTKPKRQRGWWHKLGRSGGNRIKSLMSLERSAFMAHGLYIINLAFEKPWLCMDPGCQVHGQHTEIKQDCKLVQRMIRRGLWFLRRAKSDEDSFCHRSNRRDIRVGAGWAGRGMPWLPELFFGWFPLYYRIVFGYVEDSSLY